MKFTILFIAISALFSLTAEAQVRKCIGSDGKVTYSDFGCAASTAHETGVKTHNNTIDASGFREESSRQKTAAAVDQAMQQGASRCKFSYYAVGDSRGKELAAAAKQECLNNIAAKASGQPTSLEAYNFWKDYRSQKTTERENAVNRASAEQNARTIADSNRDAAMMNRKPTYICKPTFGRDALECN